MKSTLQEAIGLSGDAWLRVNSQSGQIEQNSNGQWVETGWRYNAATRELEVLLGSAFERSGFAYSETSGDVTRLSKQSAASSTASSAGNASRNFKPIRLWFSNRHNFVLIAGLVLVVFSILGFHRHSDATFPTIPVALSIVASLLATWLMWRRCSLMAVSLFILASFATRSMWLYPILHHDTAPTTTNTAQSTVSDPPTPVPTDKVEPSKKLYQYVKDQDVVGVEEIIGQGADPNFPNLDSSGKSPLHLAAASGNEKIVGNLLDRGAAIDAQDAEGDTALHAAVEADSFEVVQALLNHGADPAIRAKAGQNALDRTIKTIGKQNRSRVFQLIFEALIARGELVPVPDKNPPAAGAVTAKETSVESLARQIKVVSDANDMCAWTLLGKTIYSSPYLQTSDSTRGEPSPDGKYIHFGSMKENANRRSPLVFLQQRDSLSYLGDITPRVIKAVNESGILPVGRRLDDECFVDVVRWSGPGKLVLSAYCRQRGPAGFSISNFGCQWDIANDSFSRTFNEVKVDAEVKFHDDQVPDPNNQNFISSGETEKFRGEIHPETRSRSLNEFDVSDWNRDKAQYAINEMFARHGLYFKSDKTRATFSHFPWYKPDPALSMDLIESRFSSIEAANLKLLGAVRDRGTTTAANPSAFTGGSMAQEGTTRPDSQAFVEDFRSQTQGQCTGITYYETPTGQGAAFNSQAESRIEYSFARGFPTQGTLELKIYISGAYGYSQGVADPNRKDALIFTTVGPDTWYQGSSWLTVSRNGNVTFGLVEMVKDKPQCRNLVAKATKFRFGEWHDIGISYGAKGRMINVDGVVVAKDDLAVRLGAGGTPTQVVDVPTLGEMHSTCWPNNFHDSGFNGIIDTFRASHAQADWKVCTKP